MDLSDEFSRVATSPQSWGDFLKLSPEQKRFHVSGLSQVVDLLSGSNSIFTVKTQDDFTYWIGYGSSKPKRFFIIEGLGKKNVTREELSEWLMNLDPERIWGGDESQVLYKKAGQ